MRWWTSGARTRPCARIHAMAHVSTVAGLIGTQLVSLGELDEARRMAEECRTLGGDDDVTNQVLWRRIEARLATLAGDAARARALIAEAVAYVERTDDLLARGLTYVDQAVIEEQLGDRDAARAALARAEAAYRAKGATVAVDHVAGLRSALEAAEAGSPGAR